MEELGIHVLFDLGHVERRGAGSDSGKKGKVTWPLVLCFFDL